LYWLIYSEESKMSENIRLLKTDHIKFHLSFLNIMQNNGLIDKDEKDKEIEALNERYNSIHNCENIDINNIKFPGAISLSKMLDNNTRINPAFVEAYKGYFLFSKLEHSGDFTRTILEENLKEDSKLNDYIDMAIITIESTLYTFFKVYFANEVITQKLYESSINYRKQN
jgi:hypothetical protein